MSTRINVSNDELAVIALVRRGLTLEAIAKRTRKSYSFIHRAARVGGVHSLMMSEREMKRVRRMNPHDIESDPPAPSTP